MQKKILILNYEHHSNFGGTERYTKNLVDILTNSGYKVFEIDYHPFQKKYLNENKNYVHIDHKIKIPKRTNRIVDLPLIIFKFFWNTFKFKKLVNKTIRKNKINIVIDNTVNAIPYARKKKVNYIFICNFDVIETYNDQNKSLIKKLKNYISFQPNKFKFDKIIVYSKKDKDALLKIDKKIKSNNILTCILAHKNLEQMNNFNLQEKIEKAEKIIWMGKICHASKNIKFIAKIAEKLNNLDIYIYIYGDGEDKNLIIGRPGIKYEGSFKKEEVDKILNEAKILLLPSFSEGFGYVIVEALSNGVPCLVANVNEKSRNANYLIDDTRGKCINNFNVNCWVKEIEFFENLNKEDYLKYSENSLNFAKQNLTTDKFKNFWKDLIKEI